jgi:hypothetical protein
MKLFDEVRSVFSPYEIAAAGRLLNFAFIGLAVVLAVTGRVTAFLLLMPVAAVVGLLAGELSRCRTCGKRPTKFYLLDRETGIGRFLFQERYWPERECSSCRTRLDGI